MRVLLPVTLLLCLACAGGGKNNCGEGTVEVDGECVAADDSGGTDNGGGDNGGGDNGGGDNGGGDNGGNGGDSGDGEVSPRVLSFTASESTFYVERGIELSVIATDPQGIDDVIGARLDTPSGVTYGTMSSSAEEGVYSIYVHWTDVEEREALTDFEGSHDLTFVAVLYDQAGHEGRGELVIPASCDPAGNEYDPAAGDAWCDGSCTFVESDRQNCGACGNVCDQCDDAICYDVTQVCAELETLSEWTCDAACASEPGGECRESGGYVEVGTVYTGNGCTGTQYTDLYYCGDPGTGANRAGSMECDCRVPR